jgi:phospholipid/cholesterol/gamma-HCH transport system permease protein
MSENRVVRLLGTVGGAGMDLVLYLGGLGCLFKESLRFFTVLALGLGGRKRGGFRTLFFQMVRIGVRSVPIVSLVVFFVGMIIALQMAYVLKGFGAPQAVPAVVGVAMLRELGPLLTAIVLTGFAGASIAAEIGTMVVSEEILALESEAMNPIQFLVMPRVIASALMLLCLTIFANFIGILGGFTISGLILGLSPNFYYAQTVEFLKVQDLLTGLIKSVVFGTLIALIACQEGLRVKGGAEGVGRATTLAVVYGIVALISTDLFFSWFFFKVL